jgi:hypothetical protein
VSADRRALLLGSWQAAGRDKPSPQRVRGVIERLSALLAGDDRYHFRSLSDRTKPPAPLLNPARSDVTRELFDIAADISTETELLIYFLGHSLTDGVDDVRLILGTSENGETNRFLSLQRLLSDLVDDARFKKLVLILDCCHVGRSKGLFRSLEEQVFVMFATGSAYAFNASFSESLIRSLEQPIQWKDQRVDRRLGGVTYKKIFEDAKCPSRNILIRMNRL